MKWECSECGSIVEREHAPVRCRACRIADTTFVPVDEMDEPADDENTLQDHWIELGMELPRFVHEHRPGHLL